MDDLLRRIQYDNDEHAFRELYQSQFFRLHRFAYTYVGTRESAEEVVHDVFLNLWTKRTALDRIGNPQVYLYVSVKNTAMNYLRKTRRTRMQTIEDAPHPGGAQALNPESLLISRELQRQISEAVESLPPRCRLIFKLVKEDGLSYKEVAAILDLSVKTVDTQLYLALKKLAGALRPLCREYFPAASTA